MAPRALQLQTIVSQPFEENTYVASLEGSQECLVIDPGMEPEKILDYLDAQGLAPAAILNTHGHADHIAGNECLKARWPNVPLAIGRGDAEKLTNPDGNLSAAFGGRLISPTADVLLADGDVYRAAGFELEVALIPGHSKGHVVFIWRGSDPWLVFGGDVLFSGSIGRTDFPDGDAQQLTEGIHSRLFVLPDDTLVLPGHGPPTTIGQEQRTNPWVGIPSGYRPQR